MLNRFFITFVLFIICNLAFIIFPQSVLAQCQAGDWRCIIGSNITAPVNVPGATGDEQISYFVSLIIQLIFITAAIVFVFLIVLGAFGWMTSGGEKEVLAKARGRIVNAIIGLIILSLAFVIVSVISTITGISILSLPPNPAQPGTPGCGSHCL